MGRRTGRAGDATSIADALFPTTRQRVLGLLFGQPGRSFALAELIELAASGTGAVQRELERLVTSGLVSISRVGRQKQFTANQKSPIFDELRGIVEKTGGVPDIVRAALTPLADAVAFAVLYGSVAKSSERADSDIDVLLVSDRVTLEEVFEALATAEKRLARRVSPTVYTSAEFQRRRRSRHPFLTKVLGGKHVVLLGSEDAIAAR